MVQVKTNDNRIENLTDVLNFLEPPILIVSTKVGRGNISVGEAIYERIRSNRNVYHIAIEDMLPPEAINEDMLRYKFISTNFPFFLYLVYRIPIFYYRKLIREKIFKNTNLNKIGETISSLGIKTIITISHRATFWLSAFKKRRKAPDFKLLGVLTEFGRSFGWKYIFWEEINSFISPLNKEEFDFNFSRHMEFIRSDIPVRPEYYKIAESRGDKKKVLLIGGFFGQGSIYKVLRKITKKLPQIEIIVMCGENIKLYKKVSFRFKRNPKVKAYGAVDSLAPFLKECASVITKPGMSTLLEAYAAKRNIFLLKGIPVAEDNNARYAIEHFNAQWFDVERFKRWHEDD